MFDAEMLDETDKEVDEKLLATVRLFALKKFVAMFDAEMLDETDKEVVEMFDAIRLPLTDKDLFAIVFRLKTKFAVASGTPMSMSTFSSVDSILLFTNFS
jgi:hypothetical protein